MAKLQWRGGGAGEGGGGKEGAERVGYAGERGVRADLVLAREEEGEGE